MIFNNFFCFFAAIIILVIIFCDNSFYLHRNNINLWRAMQHILHDVIIFPGGGNLIFEAVIVNLIVRMNHPQDVCHQ